MSDQKIKAIRLQKLLFDSAEDKRPIPPLTSGTSTSMVWLRRLRNDRK
jgi:hypothetical protein